jgi:type IV pilus assembly protein PilY1
LLDGTPVVRDIVFDRTPTQLAGNSCTALACTWHTALVAGFGSGAQGYYGLDVTDPSATTDLSKGAQFLWQLTKMPKWNNQPDRELFGQTSATPAITSVYIQQNGATHEVGVAILPGGSPGPSPGGSCARFDPVGKDKGPLVGFQKRASVRKWATNCTDPVAGRSVTVVRLDTGEVLRAFGRKQDLPNALIAANRVGLVETGLDSPMTGQPVVFPNQIGAVAEKFFMGDSDGALWRFDLSSKDPQEWTGELFIDAYNGQAYSSNTPELDGQRIQVPPLLSLDTLGRVVMHFATGDQESYTTTGNNFVYSVSETVQNGALRANVNWWQQFTNGERVSGPMVVFDSTLYFSTFLAGGNSNACSGGNPKLWGRDFVLPKDTNDLSLGGVPRLQPPINPPPQPPDFVDPTTYDPTTVGKVIPGVSVNVTPACAATSNYNDSYTGGMHTAFDNVSPGSYSLFTPVGGKNQGNNGSAIGSFKIDLPQPRTASIIDAWASVVE